MKGLRVVRGALSAGTACFDTARGVAWARRRRLRGMACFAWGVAWARGVRRGCPRPQAAASLAAAAWGIQFSTGAGCTPAAQPAAHVLRLSQDAHSDVHEHHGVILVDLHSRSGIGTATLEFTGPARAARFVLHTSGLEQFRLAYADVVVELAVGRDGTLRQTTNEGRGAARPLDPRDPLWMPVRVTRADRGPGAAAGALEAVEIETPSAFDPVTAGRCTVSWVDFFR